MDCFGDLYGNGLVHLRLRVHHEKVALLLLCCEIIKYFGLLDFYSPSSLFQCWAAVHDETHAMTGARVAETHRHDENHVQGFQ